MIRSSGGTNATVQFHPLSFCYPNCQARFKEDTFRKIKQTELFIPSRINKVSLIGARDIFCKVSQQSHRHHNLLLPNHRLFSSSLLDSELLGIVQPEMLCHIPVQRIFFRMSNC